MSLDIPQFVLNWELVNQVLARTDLIKLFSSILVIATPNPIFVRALLPSHPKRTLIHLRMIGAIGKLFV